jgi:MFS family permease
LANLMPSATFAATIPAIDLAWELQASEAGWIGGIYFAGYAASVPVLASATDRLDGRWIYLGCSLLGAISSLAVAWADGFWVGLLLRFLSGVALAGVQMPGLKLLADRSSGSARARGSAIYTASYALGGRWLVPARRRCREHLRMAAHLCRERHRPASRSRGNPVAARAVPGAAGYCYQPRL